MYVHISILAQQKAGGNLTKSAGLFFFYNTIACALYLEGDTVFCKYILELVAEEC